MMKLSTGQDSTLATYLKLCDVVFGTDSVQSKFILEKITTSPNGANEEVIADESQMMYLLVNLPAEGTDEMKELLQ